MALRVGILTSGGDAQGLNPAIRAVGRTLMHEVEDVEILGFKDGYYGLINQVYRYLKDEDLSGILNLGGTILGTSRQPFKTIDDPLPNRGGESKLDLMVQNYETLELDALCVLGGNGSNKTANALSQRGLNVVSMPKTIDNDIYGTDQTFGFASAAVIATQVIDGIHTTALAHGRTFIIEIMGHKAGWLALYSGLAGGADIILLPEIPYDPLVIVQKLQERRNKGRHFTIIVIAEGAMSEEMAKLKKSEREEMVKEFGSVAYLLQDQLEQLTDQEIRVTIPGHFQRGGPPVAYDRVLTTELGVEAAKMIMEKDFGKMAAVVDGKIDRVPLEIVASKLKTVPPDHNLIQVARMTGVCLGDRP